MNFSHEASIALIESGALKFMQSEERLYRVKGVGGYPTDTLRHLLAAGELDQDYVMSVCGATDMTYGMLESLMDIEKEYRFTLASTYKDLNVSDQITEDMISLARMVGAGDAMAESGKIAQRVVDDLMFVAPVSAVEVHHQDCHLYSSLPFIDDNPEEYLFFSLDGLGDTQCGSVAEFKAPAMNRLASVPMNRSLGLLYSSVTAVLGMRMLEHEYKVMGLAAYPKEGYWKDLQALFQSIIRVDRETGAWVGQPTWTEMLIPKLANLFRGERFDNVAAALQAHTEDCMVNWVSYWLERTGKRKVAASGGVFMNVKANQKIAALPGVDRFVVTPSSGDESTAIGAAVAASLRVEPQTRIQPVGPIYLGVEYDMAAVDQALADLNVASWAEIRRPDDMAEAAADLLAAGEVVARCAGRMEYGARALGNRSILGNPSRFETVMEINQAIKSRDFWMPFAPAILDERIEDYVADGLNATLDYMMVSCTSTPLARQHLIAAMHQADKTLRPQRVRRAWNPAYYDLIKAFERRTGIGGVLNTSFNLHGEPIVCSPTDALVTMQKSGLRHLILNDYLITKRA